MCDSTDVLEKAPMMTRIRRGKRDKALPAASIPGLADAGDTLSGGCSTTVVKKKQSKALQRHGKDAPSGGMQALLPSLVGITILACGVMAKMGFRGRATVAGIDLGTTNSVICVQSHAKGVGEIQCIPDPATGSPIVPSVVSFLDPSEWNVGPSSKVPSLLDPHPSHVVVGQAAKRRIDSHPHHTLYNAKRVLGRPALDEAVLDLKENSEFDIIEDQDGEVAFHVPDSNRLISPEQVGAYVVNHLMKITKSFLGHENIKSAVICVPAKFDDTQRMKTYEAFRRAGISIARVVEEPTAAALAYGLHKKDDVDYILVYDFGGGTLDVSLLRVSDGFVDVMGSDGDDRLGGADFDAAIAQFLLTQRGGQAVVDRVFSALNHLKKSLKVADLEEMLSARCPALASTPLCTTSSFHTLGEQLKIAMSEYPDGNGIVSADCLAPSFSVDDPRQEHMAGFCSALEAVNLRLSSEEYIATVQHLLDRSILPIQRLLADLSLQKEDIDEVVMVGGTTRMPQVRDLVREQLPRSQLNTRIDPDLTVAYGAASVID